VNVFAHVEVAHRAGGDGVDDGFLLGAALSDLASFGGFRLLGRTPDPAVAAGMAFHHRTDDAFHRHPWFRDRNTRAAVALTDRGLGRGPARACAHVGVELLLDGALHADAAARHRFRRVLDSLGNRHDVLAPLVRAEHRDDWARHLGTVAAHRGLPAHHDPDDVARRLHRICGRRPRLAFAPASIPAVAEVLTDLAPSITLGAGGLVEELAAGLADDA
jgi:hypothetical protein